MPHKPILPLLVLFAFFLSPLCFSFQQEESAQYVNKFSQAVSQAPAPAGDITIDGRFLLINNEPFYIKGVAWNPVAAGDTHPWDLDFSGYADTDIPMMQALGINTVRTYEPITDITVLDALHVAGIKVINSVYNFGGNAVSSVDNAVNAVKDHPALLMWSVGNEWNYNGLYNGLDFNTAATRVNDVAQRIKQLDPDTPVATIYGELPDSQLVTQLNHVDVWAVNVYRGISFGDLFDRWHTISEKPLFIGEYGADAYNANINQVDPESQSVAVVALTQEIFDNIVTEDNFGAQRGVLGGTFFEWADEWWKVQGGSPSQQDTGGIDSDGGPYPDSTFNEEFWGIVDIDRNARCGYYNLQALYASITNNTTFNEVPCVDGEPQTPTPTPTQTPAATQTPSVTQTPTATQTPSVTQTPTATQTPSVNSTPTATPGVPVDNGSSDEGPAALGGSSGGGSISWIELLTLVILIAACRRPYIRKYAFLEKF